MKLIGELCLEMVLLSQLCYHTCNEPLVGMMYTTLGAVKVKSDLRDGVTKIRNKET